MKIWSIRFSPSRGSHVVEERACAAEDAEAWLSVFRGDEPDVCFIASNTKPTLRRAA